jgi:urease accessory protein
VNQTITARAAVHTDTATRWRAHLSLEFLRRHDRTVLARRRHEGPLLVQRPFPTADGSCHIYLIHPPGGVAGGDELKLDAALEPGAAVLFTTPAATKFYRALPDRIARVTQRIRLRGAQLEWLPQENIYFRSARVRSLTRIDLDRQSRFIGWEINCYGRPACDERFDDGSLRLAFELWLDGRPLLLDAQRHDGAAATREAPWTHAGFAASGCLLAWPCTPALLQTLREANPAPAQLTLSLVDGVLCVRALGQQGEEVRLLLASLWRRLRHELLALPDNPPRIWAT